MPILDRNSQAATIFVCLAASVVEFATTADTCTNENYNLPCSNKKVAWALACGVVSTFLCIVALILTRAFLGRPAAVDVLLSVLLVGIWVFGAAFNTSTNGIYVGTGNGYFSTWIALLAAANYAHLALGNLTQALQTHLTLGGPILVLVSSIIEMSSAADLFANRNDDASPVDEPRVEFAIAVGALSTTLCGIQLLLLYLHVPIAETSGKALGLLLVALWAAGAGVNTSSKGPFSTTTNGYFFSWVAFGASIHYAYNVWLGARQDIYADAYSQPVATNPNEPPIVPPPVVGTGPGYQTLE